MKDDNKLKISEASLEDYSEVVHLFNRNHVYQFPDGRPLTVDDLDLTLKVKEVTHLFLLKNHGVLIGTSAFFKFITYGCLDWNSSFSGFLLIDSKSRSGQAITYLYKTILKKITKLKFSNIYTEISNYNKPSLALSKLNGFKEYDK
ncbi:TPA: cylE protein, partial [Streptococcus agalactiae]